MMFPNASGRESQESQQRKQKLFLARDKLVAGTIRPPCISLITNTPQRDTLAKMHSAVFFLKLSEGTMFKKPS